MKKRLPLISQLKVNAFIVLIWFIYFEVIPNPTIKVAPKHEQLTTEFFVAV